MNIHEGWSLLKEKEMDMKRGTLVCALKNLDPEGANVLAGQLGVVFEESNAYADGCGPMVRWFTNRACNVYYGDVAEVRTVYHPMTLEAL